MTITSARDLSMFKRSDLGNSGNFLHDDDLDIALNRYFNDHRFNINDYIVEIWDKEDGKYCEGCDAFVTVLKRETGEFLGRFYLQQMPGCCGILVLYNSSLASTKPLNRTCDIYSELTGSIAKAIAIETGYTIMTCTNYAMNDKITKSMLDFGWKIKDTFDNYRTGNTINVYSYNLPPNDSYEDNEDDFDDDYD